MSLLDTASLIVTPNGYKEGKLYSVIPSDGSGDLSVTRATTATRVNSAGLVELVPYNLVQYSEQFDNAAWTKNSVSVTANSTTAPNGTTTADTITETSTLGFFYQTASASGVVTFSVYLKRTNNDWANVTIATTGSPSGEFRVWFNLATGAVGTTANVGAGVVTDSDIESVGNGWYRVSVTGYVTGALGYTTYIFNTNADNSFTTSVGQSRYQWAAQLVEGSTAKDYQKTETRLNIPRLDYSNGTCPSLLVEPQRTNELLYSSSFSSAAWNIRSNIAIDLNSTTSPDGNTNAAKMRVTNNSICDYGAFEVLTSGTRVFSVFAKKAELGYLYLGYENNVPSEGVFFNLNDGTISQNTSGLTANIEDFGNGWYRCSVNLVNKTNHFISPSANGTSFALTNQQNNGIYIWGAQAELGSYSTSYIPTTSASVTRNADVISKSGIGSLIGQTEGTLFIDTYIEDLAAQTNDPVLIYAKGTSADAYIEIADTGHIVGVFFDGSAVQCLIYVNVNLTNGRHKFAFGYKDNDFTLFLDGTEVGADTSGIVSGSLTEFGLQYYDNFYRGKQYVNAAALWKTRLTNTQLAQLTTI